MTCVDLKGRKLLVAVVSVHLANSDPGSLSLSNHALAESALATSWRATKDDHNMAGLCIRSTCPGDAGHVIQHP